MSNIILITGGAGFIGSNIAKRLISMDKKVIIVDNLSSGKVENIPPQCTFLKLDLGNPDDVKRLYDFKIDAILHLAGQSSGEISYYKPTLDFNSHVVSTFQLLLLSKQKNINRFIYASSMGVYGDPEKNIVSERSETNPKSFYGNAKLCAENYIKFFQRFGIRYTIFRMFNVYGPDQNLDNKSQGMLSIYLSFLIDNVPIIVKGSKNRFRDFIYIDDVVDAWCEALDNENSYNTIFNLGSGKKTTVEEVLNYLIENFGYDNYPIIYEKGTPGDQFGLYADISLIKNRLFWFPKVSIKEGIRKTFDKIKEVK